MPHGASTAIAIGPDRIHANKLLRAESILAQRGIFETSNAILALESQALRDLLAAHATRPDLLAEMSGLAWSLGVVDLRSLIAFQRRLVFRDDMEQCSIAHPNDWPALIALSFGNPKPIHCETAYDRATHTLTLRSSNPNLHVRITDEPASPIAIHAGGPFFEVAQYRGRWFLRDGYHRAYALLQAGVFAVPAVIVEARTLEELGANHPWFFSEEVLFSATPPLVVDFLNADLVIQYTRPQLIKTLRITLEESLAPIGEQI